MSQLQLFDQEQPAAPRTVVVEYFKSDFETAIAQAHEQYRQGIGVIAVPRALWAKLRPKRQNGWRSQP